MGCCNVPSLGGSCFEHEGLNEIGELPLDLQGRVFFELPI